MPAYKSDWRMRDLGGSRLGTTQFRLGDAVRVRGLEALDEPNTAPPPMPVPAAKSPNAFQTSMRERMHRKLSTSRIKALLGNEKWDPIEN